MSNTQKKQRRLDALQSDDREASEQYVWQKERARAVRDAAISVSHHCASCVLDKAGRILTHTEKFPSIIDQGFIHSIDLQRKKPKLLLQNDDDQKQFEALFQPVLDQERVATSHLYISNKWVWRVVIQELDPPDSNTLAKLHKKRQFMVRFLNLVLRNSVRPYLSVLQKVFSLTPAELNLCAELLESRTLPQASARLGVKVSTARTQLKSIFEKVEVNSQPALIARLTTLIIRYECANPV